MSIAVGIELQTCLLPCHLASASTEAAMLLTEKLATMPIQNLSD